MAAKVVTVNRDTKPGIAPIFTGMKITFMNLVRTLFGGQAATVQFPEQKRSVSTRSWERPKAGHWATSWRRSG